jgi:hypothetical protein
MIQIIDGPHDGEPNDWSLPVEWHHGQFVVLARVGLRFDVYRLAVTADGHSLHYQRRATREDRLRGSWD